MVQMLATTTLEASSHYQLYILTRADKELKLLDVRDSFRRARDRRLLAR